MSAEYDLDKKKYELEQIFDSLIGKIPDLCHLPALRFEGENDFFNQTKDLKLEPFRTQEAFERCVTPTLDDLRHEAVTSPTGLYEKAKFRNSSPEEASRNASCKSDYPFANPIPQCMLANGYDDLRKLILSQDIEWRMLTPIRPASEYEEKYFDKLVKLHRYHNQNRIEMASDLGKISGRGHQHLKDNFQVTSFKHTRHGVTLPSGDQRCDRDRRGRRTLSTSVRLGVRLKGRFHPRSRTSITGQMAKVGSTIPTLTFTTEDEIVLADSESKEEGQSLMKATTTLVDDDASNSPQRGSGGRLLPASSPQQRQQQQREVVDAERGG